MATDNSKNKKSDDKVDAIAAFVLIAAFVTGMVYWLASMPS